MRAGYLAVYGLFFSAVVASSVLLAAFLARDFSFAYVAAELRRQPVGLLPHRRLLGRPAGLVPALAALLAVVTVVIALRNVERDRPPDGRRRGRAGRRGRGLLRCSWSPTRARTRSSRPPPRTAGQGLNPLLLHPAMVLHPPALFAGYVGLTVPFAFATAALLLGDAGRDWVLGAQKWAVAGWAFLSLGIGLGAWWAYVVLSWGGYWGWDPVENTSLIPWLTATALLHSLTLYRRRGLLQRWALALACATFWLHDRRHLDDAHRPDQLGARLRAQRHADRHPLGPARGRRRACRSACWPGAGGGSARRASRPPPLASRDVRPLPDRTSRSACCAAALLVATVVVPLAAGPHRGARHLPPVRPAARRRRRGGARALPAARLAPTSGSGLLARTLRLAAAGRRRRAAACCC